MKTRSLRHSAHGFTLVELLVVISIIAVLAAASFAGAKAAIDSANKVKAKKICTTIDTAVLTFYDQYGHLPLPAASQSSSQDIEIITTDSQGVDLINILMGLENDSDDMLNPKNIRFLDVAEGKSNKDGIIYSSGENVRGLYDPWGQPYHVLLDANYDNTLDNNPFASGSKPLRRRRVGTYTFGKNKKNDQGGRDDVKSW